LGERLFGRVDKNCKRFLARQSDFPVLSQKLRQRGAPPATPPANDVRGASVAALTDRQAKVDLSSSQPIPRWLLDSSQEKTSAIERLSARVERINRPRESTK
jgi:hypothetical protein